MEIGFLVRQYNKLKNMTNLLPLFAIYNFIVLAKWENEYLNWRNVSKIIV